MPPSPDEPPQDGWVPICAPCWKRLHDECEGGTTFCCCLCPCFWQPPNTEET